MVEILSFREHAPPCEIQLSIREADTLRQNFSKQLDLWSGIEPGSYWIKPKQYIGVIALPSGKVISIEPKAPISTIFAILSRVYDPTKQVFDDKPHPYSTVADLFEFIVAFFVGNTEDLIARGLLRGYQSKTEEAVAIRGRILIPETLSRRPGLYDKHYCSYRHFSPDIPENRILLWTIYNLRGWKYVETDLHSRLYRTQRALADVDLDPTAGLLFEHLEFHRLNDSYQPALVLAKLILDHLSFSGSQGEDSFLAYLLDMNELFEKYLAVVLGYELGKFGFTIREQETHNLDSFRKIQVKPDILLYRGSSLQMIIDAKYKLKEAQTDIYQMLAYCHALNLNCAILVHPNYEAAPSGELTILGPGRIQIFYLQLDLQGGTLELSQQANNLANRILTILSSHLILAH